MTELEIIRLIEEIRADMDTKPESVNAEWSIGKNYPIKYEVNHHGKTCVFEVFNNDELKVSRLKVDDFQADYQEGSAIFKLISEFAIWL